MTQLGGRDVLVVLREELVAARAALRELDAVEPDAAAGKKLKLAADALDARIRGPFDEVLLDRAAAAFRAAHLAVSAQLGARRDVRRSAPDVQRVLKRVVVHAREIGRMTHESGADHVGAAIDALARPEAWTGAHLDALVSLVDTLQLLARQRLGPSARPAQLSSLVDRAASTAVVSSLSALKDLARRARHEPTVMRDRFQLDGALRAPVLALIERLSQWFKLDDEGRSQLRAAIEAFTRRLLDFASQRA